MTRLVCTSWGGILSETIKFCFIFLILMRYTFYDLYRLLYNRFFYFIKFFLIFIQNRSHAEPVSSKIRFFINLKMHSPATIFKQNSSNTFRNETRGQTGQCILPWRPAWAKILEFYEAQEPYGLIVKFIFKYVTCTWQKPKFLLFYHVWSLTYIQSAPIIMSKIRLYFNA
jgi:hypothetical protein